MTPRQTTNTIMMVRPSNFGYNEETAENNSFQINDKSIPKSTITVNAKKEFDGLVQVLRDSEINIFLVEDSSNPVNPDAVFPNNWISFHEDATIITYPMFSPNRRLERDERIINLLKEEFKIEHEYTFAYYEEKDMFLEGTGSMILDRVNRVVYACLSPRTDIKVIEKFCVLKGYKKVVFYAKDENGEDIYHTNVMMALGTSVAIVCLESIAHPEERNEVIASLKATNKEIVDLTIQQVNQFAGNMLEVHNQSGQSFMVMSASARKSLNPEQVAQIQKSCHILSYPIPTIEKYGGGSVRCMMAEVFLPKK